MPSNLKAGVTKYAARLYNEGNDGPWFETYINGAKVKFVAWAHPFVSGNERLGPKTFVFMDSGERILVDGEFEEVAESLLGEPNPG